VITVDPSSAVTIATSTTSAAFGAALAPGSCYEITCSVASWLTVAATPVAVASAAGNVFVPAGGSVNLQGPTTASKVAVITVTGSGTATLMKARNV
jgi:hypothetical protein